MQIEELISAAEAVLFASGEPIDRERLAQVLGIEHGDVDKLMLMLNDRLDRDKSALYAVKLENEYQMTVRREYAEIVKSAVESKRNTALSPAAMEVLTVAAYNQPVTKGFIESVRGVDSSSTVNSLVEKGLLAEAGRLELPGRPIAYKTTGTFLRCFQLESLKDLPEVPAAGQMSLDGLDESDGMDAQE